MEHFYNLFVLNFQHQDTNFSTDLLLRYEGLINSFIGIFIICDFGEKFETAFRKIQINRLDWYLLSCDTQKLLSTILIITQKPLALNIFGSISCNRITFKTVS